MFESVHLSIGRDSSDVEIRIRLLGFYFPNSSGQSANVSKSRCDHIAWFIKNTLLAEQLAPNNCDIKEGKKNLFERKCSREQQELAYSRYESQFIMAS